MSYPFYPLPLAPIIFLLGLPQSLLKSWPLLLRLLSTTDVYTQGCINTTCWVYLRGREFRADPWDWLICQGSCPWRVPSIPLSSAIHCLWLFMEGQESWDFPHPLGQVGSWHCVGLVWKTIVDFFFHRCSFIVIYTGHSRGCVGAGHLKDSSSLYFDQLGKFINALSPSKKKGEIWFDLIWFGVL